MCRQAQRRHFGVSWAPLGSSWGVLGSSWGRQDAPRRSVWGRQDAPRRLQDASRTFPRGPQAMSDRRSHKGADESIRKQQKAHESLKKYVKSLERKRPQTAFQVESQGFYSCLVLCTFPERGCASSVPQGLFLFVRRPRGVPVALW
jgi:hypothetical protein